MAKIDPATALASFFGTLTEETRRKRDKKDEQARWDKMYALQVKQDNRAEESSKRQTKLTERQIADAEKKDTREEEFRLWIQTKTGMTPEQFAFNASQEDQARAVEKFEMEKKDFETNQQYKQWLMSQPRGGAGREKDPFTALNNRIRLNMALMGEIRQKYKVFEDPLSGQMPPDKAQAMAQELSRFEQMNDALYKEIYPGMDLAQEQPVEDPFVTQTKKRFAEVQSPTPKQEPEWQMQTDPTDKRSLQEQARDSLSWWDPARLFLPSEPGSVNDYWKYGK